MCYFKWLILRVFRITWVLKQTQMCIFCYRALLYNFVIKFHSIEACLIWWENTRGLIVKIDERDDTPQANPRLCAHRHALERMHYLWRCLGHCGLVDIPVQQMRKLKPSAVQGHQYVGEATEQPTRGLELRRKRTK